MYRIIKRSPLKINGIVYKYNDPLPMDLEWTPHKLRVLQNIGWIEWIEDDEETPDKRTNVRKNESTNVQKNVRTNVRKNKRTKSGGSS